MMRKKVLFCINSGCGGAERVTLTIAKLLDRTKYDIKIVLIGKKMGETMIFIPDYMNVINVKIRNIWDFTICRLVKLFMKERPDVVFCSLFHINVRMIIAAKIVGNIKIIIRNNSSFNHLRFDNALLVKTIYHLSDVIILQTEEQQREMLKLDIDKNKLHVLFNPIDKGYIETMLKDTKSIFDNRCLNYVYIGRIHQCKGLEILLDAFSKILNLHNNAKLYIVGKIYDTDQYYQFLKRKIEELNLKNNIIWTDFTNNPYQYIKFADCLVLPSRIEGLPNVLLEARYLQTPIVATRSVPIVDRIVTKDFGFVVPVDDSEKMFLAMSSAPHIKISNEQLPNTEEKIIALFDNLTHKCS